MLDILGITVPIYLTIALGYVCTRMGLFAKAEMQVFGRFTLQLALPALLFNALSQRSVAEILNLNYLLAYALGSLLVMGLGLWWARRVLGQSLSYSSMVAMGMSCPNSGFVGYPIILLSFGPVAGVALALNMVVKNFLLLPLLLAIADAQGRPGQWPSVLLQTVKNVLQPHDLRRGGGFCIFAVGPANARTCRAHHRFVCAVQCGVGAVCDWRLLGGPAGAGLAGHGAAHCAGQTGAASAGHVGGAGLAGAY